MNLRVVALSAPQFAEGAVGARALGSLDPASLFNACRYAALLAERGIGAWGESNWAGGRSRRRACVQILHGFRDDLSILDTLLETEQPNLLLIGAMSLCLPGAFACAQRAKAILGDTVFTVLGGVHASETIYADSVMPMIRHHPGSPLRLIAEGRQPNVFDLVIAGEAEHITAHIGEVIGRQPPNQRSPREIREALALRTSIPGNWIAGWVDGSFIKTHKGRTPLDHDILPPPCEMFGVRTAFETFGKAKTAHVFSDSGPGCAFDCHFCSERRSVAGQPAQRSTSAARLVKQLRAAVRVIAEDSPGFRASAFVEDSTLLAGWPRALDELVTLLEREPLDIRFGAQLTVDQILGREDLLRRLKAVGLDYLFIGIETIVPSSVGGMSKDVRRREQSWEERIERTLEILASNGIGCGAALLFGLGETPALRRKLFHHLERWRERYGAPMPISLNWAVQHPLKGNDGGAGYRYDEWGIPPGPMLEVLQHFGEASLRYPIVGQRPPVLEEVREIVEMVDALR